MKKSKRLTFSNVVSVAALIVATAGAGGGVAYAHGKVGSNQIKANAVKSKHVKDNNLKSKDVRNDNLRGVDVKNGSLGANDLNGKTTSGLAEAGVNMASNGNLSSWFNRMGGAPTTNRTSAGLYTVNFPGTTPSNSSVIATANSGFSTLNCVMFNVQANGTLQVACRNNAGALADTDFHLLLSKS